MYKNLSKSTFTTTLFLLACAPISALAQSTPIFHASFNQGTEADIAASSAKPLEDSASPIQAGVIGAAVSIPRGKQLVYEGSGNAYISSGTLSFFWRSDEKLGQEQSDVFTISGFQRFYFCRWLRLFTQGEKLRLGFYTNEYSNDNGLELIANDVLLTPKSWHHVAVSWDQGRGVALYVDGALAASSAKPWFYGGNINHIGLAVRATSYARPGTATWAQSFDEVQIFEHWMSASDVARLAKKEDPQLTAVDLEPLLQERKRRLGLENGPSLPLLKDTETLRLQQLAIPQARDVLISARSGLDGDMGRAWPGAQGYSNAGKELHLTLHPNTSFNVLQAFASGPMKIGTVIKSTFDRELLTIPSGDSQMATSKLAHPIQAEHLVVERESGLLFNMQIFNADSSSMPTTNANGWEFTALNVAESPAQLEPIIGNEFPSYDRLTLAASGKASNADHILIPALQAAHLLGTASSKQRGLSSLALDLAVKQDAPETTVSVIVVDPLNYERRAAMVNIRTTKNSNGRFRLVLDLRDLVIPADTRPWVILYTQNPLQLDLSQSRIGFQWSSVDAALNEFLPDQMAYAKEAFQELSEARPWAHDPNKRKWLRSMLHILDLLHELRPDNYTVSGYWNWTHPREPIALTKLPEVPEGVAPWAIYTSDSIEKFQQAAHWWIDNRMTPEGEFGAPDGLNDDTDLIQDWLAIDLMRGPDPKIRRAVDLVANATWNQTTVDGISRQVTDTLHMYEWGINAQTLAFLLNIGDPVYYERLLRFASHYDEMTGVTGEKHHRHFKSWYLGADKIVTEGIYGQDRGINALLLQPAMLLAWYNGDPKAKSLVVDWSRSMMEHIDEQAKVTSRTPGISVQFSDDNTIPERNFGIAFPEAVWAAFDLTGDRSFLDAYGRLVDYEISRKPLENLLRTPSALASYLRESGDARWDKRWEQNAEDPQLWTLSQHNDNYRSLYDFYAAWLRTGNDQWLNRGSGLALHHMTWSLPMLTEAEQTTDRVWLPQNLANQMTLGDLSILRNKIYPKHAVSWENASGRIAPLVREQTDKTLEMEIYNLENKPVKVDARIWRLKHGEYAVLTSSAPPSAPNQKTTKNASIVLSRFSVLPVTLPPSSVTTISITQTKALEDLRDASDLGISWRDAVLTDGNLTFTVHNIGAQISDAFDVVVSQQGKIIAKQHHSALGTPENYRTQKAVFTIPLMDTINPVTIDIISAAHSVEITTANNSVTFIPAARSSN